MPAINDIIVRTRTELRDIEINLINDFIFFIVNVQVYQESDR